MQPKTTMRYHIGKNIQRDNAKYWSVCRVGGPQNCYWYDHFGKSLALPSTHLYSKTS